MQETVSQLNFTKEQELVVTHPLQGHAKVVAVAGAGKTTTLIGRIEWLLKQSVDVRHIGVFMFNKSAQEEFQQRLQKRLEHSGTLQTPSVMTFHAFGHLLCRRLEQANILTAATLVTDEYSQVKLLKEAMQRLHKRSGVIVLLEEKEWIEEALLFIDQVKAAAQPAIQVFKIGDWREESAFLPALYDIAEQLRLQKKLRFFSDLLFDPLMILEKNNAVQDWSLRHLIQEFKYLLIDEFQDINPCQYRLLKALYTPTTTQWMIVGDVQQCIYEWRGASPHIMSEIFPKEFAVPPLTEYHLSQSFRFGHQIGLMATHVIANNNSQSLVSGIGNETEFMFSQNEKVGQSVLTALKHWVGEGEALEDCAILVRLYSDMVPIQLALMHRGIPYHLHGDSPLLDNRQIRVLLAYLAVMASALDAPDKFYASDDLIQLVTVPSLGLAANQRHAFLQQAKQAPHLLPQLIENLADELDGWRCKKLYQRADWLRSLPLYFNNPAEGLRHTVEKLGLYRYFDSTSSKSIQVKEKIATCDAFIAYVQGVGGTAESVLQQLRQLVQASQTHTQGVHLMTIHKSKGLEFGQVMLAGLQEGRFPYYDKDEVSASALEAERRLFYVAITRAKKRLLFLSAPNAKEQHYLQPNADLLKSYQESALSRFVYESMPIVVQQVVRHWQQSDTRLRLTCHSQQIQVFQRYMAFHERAESMEFELNRQSDAVSQLHPGDKVRHDSYGSGTVLRQDRQGKKMIYVDFDLVGLKRFNPQHTKLVRV